MGQEQVKQKTKKSFAQKIGAKFGKGPTSDELVKETLEDLTDIVGSMKDVFNDFEEGYEEQLLEDRSSWEKLQPKLPKFLQPEKTKIEQRRMGKIKRNRDNLAELEDNLRKLDIVLSSGKASFEAMGQAYINTVVPGEKSGEAMKELEAKVNAMQNNMSESMSDLAAQISLIKSALDNMAGQLDEQGVVIGNIDSKIDKIDTKLDKAHDMLKKISKQLTGNRVLILVIAGSATAVVLNSFLA